MPERPGALFWWGMFNELEWRKKPLRGLEGWRKAVTNRTMLDVGGTDIAGCMSDFWDAEGVVVNDLAKIQAKKK